MDNGYEACRWTLSRNQQEQEDAMFKHMCLRCERWVPVSNIRTRNSSFASDTVMNYEDCVNDDFFFWKMCFASWIYKESVY